MANLVIAEEHRTRQTAQEATTGTLPGADSIGIGYDVNGRYADSESLIGQLLFDFGKPTSITIEGRTYTYPESMGVVKSFHSKFEQDYSADIEEYRRKLGMNVGVSGKYKMFNGSLSVDYSSTDLQLSQTSYCATREVHRLWYITLPPNGWLREHLRPEVKNDINDTLLAPDELFERYGAYFVAEVGVGGRLDYTSATKALKVEQGLSISTTAQASYQWLIGQIDVNSKLARQINSYRQSSSIRLTATGGKPGMADRILYGPDSKKAFSDWANSLLDYAVLSEFTQESLRPIWELTDDTRRKRQLKEAFPDFMKKHEPPIEKIEQVLLADMLPPMLQDGDDKGSRAFEHLSVFKPSISNGFNWIGQYGQRNHNTTADGRTPIFRDIFDLGVLKRPVGWQKVWTDQGSWLTKNFACWRAIPPQGYRALGDVMVLHTDKYDPPDGNGYMCVHQALCADVTSLKDRIWRDKGSGATDDVTLWRTSAPGTVDTNAFVGIPNYSEPPSEDDIKKLQGSIACVSSKAILNKDDFDALLSRCPELSSRVAQMPAPEEETVGEVTSE